MLHSDARDIANGAHHLLREVSSTTRLGGFASFVAMAEAAEAEIAVVGQAAEAKAAESFVPAASSPRARPASGSQHRGASRATRFVARPSSAPVGRAEPVQLPGRQQRSARGFVPSLGVMLELDDSAHGASAAPGRSCGGKHSINAGTQQQRRVLAAAQARAAREDVLQRHASAQQPELSERRAKSRAGDSLRVAPSPTSPHGPPGGAPWTTTRPGSVPPRQARAIAVTRPWPSPRSPRSPRPRSALPSARESGEPAWQHAPSSPFEFGSRRAVTAALVPTVQFGAACAGAPASSAPAPCSAMQCHAMQTESRPRSATPPRSPTPPHSASPSSAGVSKSDEEEALRRALSEALAEPLHSPPPTPPADIEAEESLPAAPAVSPDELSGDELEPPPVPPTPAPSEASPVRANSGRPDPSTDSIELAATGEAWGPAAAPRRAPGVRPSSARVAKSRPTSARAPTNRPQSASGAEAEAQRRSTLLRRLAHPQRTVGSHRPMPMARSPRFRSQPAPTDWQPAQQAQQLLFFREPEGQPEQQRSQGPARPVAPGSVSSPTLRQPADGAPAPPLWGVHPSQQQATPLYVGREPPTPHRRPPVCRPRNLLWESRKQRAMVRGGGGGVVIGGVVGGPASRGGGRPASKGVVTQIPYPSASARPSSQPARLKPSRSLGPVDVASAGGGGRTSAAAWSPSPTFSAPGSPSPPRMRVEFTQRPDSVEPSGGAA